MNTFHPNQYPIGPIRMADGVLADSTSGPFFSNASNFDKSCPCPCLSEQEYFKRQCDRHQSDLEFLIEKIASKAAELTRVTFYTDQFKSYGTLRIDIMDGMYMKHFDLEEEKDIDLGTRESYHCSKVDCVHRSSFDLYLQKSTAEWEYKSYCRLVDCEHKSLRFFFMLQKMVQCLERKSSSPSTGAFDWNSLTNENRVLPECKVFLNSYLSDHGITCVDDLHYCESSNLQEIAKCLKAIPRRAFCDRHGILFED